MDFPQSEKLNIAALSRSFADMSESYKLFWFSGIMHEVKNGNNCATIKSIIVNMIVSAWYMVSEYHLNLGPSDSLEKLVLYAQNKSNLKSSSKEKDIVEYINNSDDSTIREYINVLSINVPYRLHSPFLDDLKGMAWKSRKNVIERINSDNSLMYSFGIWNGLDTEIIINDDWYNYFIENITIIEGWIEYNMIVYLQKRNPCVPGISNKLYPPTERNLENAKSLWKHISGLTLLPNIYCDDVGALITKSDISLDHFVPWSYVSHDELWNLVPTTQRLNSSKNNNLPSWEKYFHKLCDIEYTAYKCIWSDDETKRLFLKCKKDHLNSNDVISKLYKEGISKQEYCLRLEELIRPSYVAALNLGFPVWNH